MFFNTDKVSRAYFTEVPEQYLDLEPKFFAEWVKQIDVWIGLPGEENPKAVYADIPEERFARANKAGQAIVNMLNDTKLKQINIGFPTKERAANNQIDFDLYEKMHWDAVNADYQQISAKGQEIKKLLLQSKQVRITSPSGTNLTFFVGSRPIIVSDGILSKEDMESKLMLERFISLPDGNVALAPIETSANGQVVIPKARCRYAPVTNIRFDLKNGLLQNFKADEGAECFNKTMGPYTGDKFMFSSFSIGLNPALKVIEEGADYRPGDAAGMVYIGIGDNQLAGGVNKVDGSFAYYFPITRATVTIDAKTVVKNGQLGL